MGRWAMARSSLDSTRARADASAQDSDPLRFDAVRRLDAKEINAATYRNTAVVLAVPSHDPLAGRVSSLLDRAHQPPVHVEEPDAHVSRTRGSERKPGTARRRILRREARPRSLRRPERDLEGWPRGRQQDRFVDLQETRSVDRIVGARGPELVHGRRAERLLDRALLFHPERHE